ncbi:hypothetical protein [Streptococcus thoraltensis]|uniref:hypothetical protein n=1 Tax=Streptococcus thoraltensis TaxID=55085 RepID=UPI000368906B|nr:hypothetical protein [Streptococcus thoraltensis]QBX31138.1 hypothetical protein Javan616_0045 [Streptococcus phage Javan616]
MTKTYTLTEEELDQLIKERMAEKPITEASLFNTVSFNTDLLEPINAKYPEVVKKLDNNTIRYNPHPLKSVFTNVPVTNEVTKETKYCKVYHGEIHNNIRHLVLNIFGKKLNKELTRDEYDLAQEFYTNFKNLFLESYDKRLEELTR